MLRRIDQMKSHHKLFFAVLVGFAVIAFWRGVWGLMDEFLFPENYQLSLILSIIIGLVILVATEYATKELI